jgi:hypothetical protein
MSASSQPAVSPGPAPVCTLSPVRARAARCAVLAALLLAGAGCSNSVWVYVDNAGEEPMVVSVGGKTAATVAPGCFEVIKLEPGRYQFRVQCGERVLFDGEKELEKSEKFGVSRRYVFNPDGLNRYRTYTVEYGSNPFEGLFDTAEEAPEGNDINALRDAYRELLAMPELLPPNNWIEIERVDHVFEKEPEFVTTRGSSAKRTVLARVDAEDYAAIQAARQNPDPDPTEDEVIALAQVVFRVLQSGP